MLRLIATNAVGFVLLVLWASHPAAAAGDELRVIAVHTASAPRVSLVVEPPAEQPDNSATVESCAVTIDAESVACTVSPMASDDLSVALVIDTASGLTSQELATAQAGATEFLLRLPEGAHTMVVAAGGEPQVVAPLSERRAEALSAISAFRVGGSRATMAAAMLAAQSLESAAPGPRAIIVYTHGLDEQGVLTTRLSQAVLRSEAVLNIIRTGTDPLWPSVVDQLGGSVVTTRAENIAEAFGELAVTLGEQYLVTFEAPGGLPAVAQVAFQTGDQEYTTVVNLPDAGPAQAAPTESSEEPPASGVPWLVALLVVLTVLGVFVRRARQLRPADGGEPSTEVARPAAGAPPPDNPVAASPPPPQPAAAGNAPLPTPAASGPPPPADQAAPNAAAPAQPELGTPPPKKSAVPTGAMSDDPVPNRGPPPRPAVSPAGSRPARGSLSAAIEGRRLARLILNSQPESRAEPAEQGGGQADNNQTEDPPTDQQARSPNEDRDTASDSEADTKTENRQP